MLSRKITVSILVFALILTAGYLESIHLTKQHSNPSQLKQSSYSTNTNVRSYPFAPREYIRITYRAKIEPIPYKLQ
ncbi:hypothetical protein FHS15_004431 [Paenibacillus castaneae]|nr:hypothetical protein [Paenibacillus castaneae]